MRLLPFRISMGNQGARLAQPKAPLAEQTLTLTHPQANLEAPLDPGTQRLPVPQRAAQADIVWGLAEHPIHLLQLRLAQTSGAAGALPFGQPGQPLFLETSNPIFHRPRSITQQLTDLRTGHALGHQQHPVEPVIIARFFRTANLVLQPENDRFGIGNLEWSHAFMRSQSSTMRNYL
jgi:hypothetical protein